MADPLPITLDFGTLPLNGAGYTPQELADLLGLNARLFTGQAFALFTTGATAPTSDTGPWAANGNTWYYWDSGTGTYVPFQIAQSSLKYWVGSSTPDPTIYQFWIQLTGPGSPLALKVYYSGAWVDVYATTLAGYQTVAAMANYSTTVAMNAAIASAVSGVTVVAGNSSFSAHPTALQNVVFGGAGNMTGVVTLGTEDFDPDGVFAANTFTVPTTGYYQFNVSASISVSGGAPTQLDIIMSLNVNGSVTQECNQVDGTYTVNGGVFNASACLYLVAGNTVTMGYNITADAACTAEIGITTRLSGYRVR
jgi:hypothetical protein